MSTREFKLTRAEISHSISCAAAWSGTTELPDPNQWKDLVFARDACRDVAVRRLEMGRSPQRAQIFPWPKETGGTRPMAWLDPVDHAIYRATVGRLILPIYACLDSDRVLASEVVAQPPGWKLSHWRPAIHRRRARAMEMLGSYAGMGTLDIQTYFPSVRLSALERFLTSLPVHEPSVLFLLRWLGDLHQVSDIRGLPIGPEPSRVLGNGLLSLGDQYFSAADTEFVRYMDDTWCFMDDEASFNVLAEGYGHALAGLELEVNEGKTQWLLGMEARNEVARFAIAYREDALRSSGELGEGAGLDLLEEALEDAIPRKSELRRALGALTDRMHPRPAVALQEDPTLLRLAPEQWVTYLSKMASSCPWP